MTGTASPVPPHHHPHASSDAVVDDSSANGHDGQDGNCPNHDVAEPSTPSPPQRLDAAEIIDTRMTDSISPFTPDGSPLSEPPDDDELQTPSPAPLLDSPASPPSPEVAEATDATDVPKTSDTATEAEEDVKTNGPGADDKAGERPSKRRRVREPTPPPPLSGSRKPKFESPPWKRIEADGPSSFTEDGKRRSGRINTVPLELQRGDKRITRRALHTQQSSPSSKSKYASTNGHVLAPTGSGSTPGSARRSTTGSKQVSSKPSAAPKTSASKPAATSSKKPSTQESTRSSLRTRKRSPSPTPKAPVRTSARIRRPSRNARESLDLAHGEQTPDSGSRDDLWTCTAPRIKLRVRPSTLPFIHPDQAKIRPRLGPNFEEYFEKARDIPVEDGGQLATDDPPRMTDELVLQEARLLELIETETKDGGLLAQGRCSAYEPEAAEEPPRQWAHLDHLAMAMANFRKLMLIEQQRHRATAKKLAEACREEWRRRQPKSAEELEQEAQLVWVGRYRLVVRALFGTWENVKTEINRRRFEEWEAEEQRRVKAALQEAVDMSEQKLQARRAQLGDSDGMTDDDSGIERISDEEEEEYADTDSLRVSDLADPGFDAESGNEDESNMSSSDDDEDAKSTLSDEALTQEQLRKKYAHLAELDTPTGDAGTHRMTTDNGTAGGDVTEAEADETSDESVDMDDDLGSSDMGSNDDDDDSEGDDDGSDGDAEDSDEDGDGPSGLLGLFFGKSELKKLKEESAAADGTPMETEDGRGTRDEVPGDPKREVNGIPKSGNNPDHNQLNGSEPKVNGVHEYTASPSARAASPSSPIANGVCSESEVNGSCEDSNIASGLSNPSLKVPRDAPKVVGGRTKGQLTCQSSTPRSRRPTTPHQLSAIRTGTADDLAPPQFSPLSDYGDGNFSPHSSTADEVQVPKVLVDVAKEKNKAERGAPAVTVAEISDIIMADVLAQSPHSPSRPTPDLEIIAPPYLTKAITSPETDVSHLQSQSPRTSDTKPSEVDTTTSVEAPGTQNEISRSATPLSSVPKTEIPFLLRGTLREYQHAGLDWLAGLYANNTNGILADEMGLGKTIQTIALLAHLACHHEVWGPHLVIVPTSVMLNWEMEFKKWCPGFKILTYYGNQEERKRKRQGWTNDDVWNVCITSYQMVLQDQQVFRRRRWHYMILDEAHNIKNFKSQRWQTLLGFNTHSRLLLTGTPLQNNLTELWSLLFFLMPSENGVGGFADLKEFHDWFSKPESQILESGREQMDDEARAIIAKLHKVLRPYLLRRLKADVEKQMPAKYEHVELCRLSKRQRELYDGFLSRTDTRETLASGNYLSIINCLMQLRKVCNHPDLFVDRPIMTSFRMQSSVPAMFEPVDKLVRDRLFSRNVFRSVSLSFMNLIPTQHERFSDDFATSVAQLSSHRILSELRDFQRQRAENAILPLDPSTVESNIIYLESAARWGRFEELQHCVYLNALRRQQRPIYGERLVELLTLGIQDRPFKPRPKVPKKVMGWFENDSFLLRNAVQTLDRRADSMEMIITKFACVTPAVVTRDLIPLLIGRKGVQAFEETDLRLSAPVKTLPFIPGDRPHDPWHEARMRLSIQFPDKRLLQYDCGKLQALDKLLRRLQSGGHRALIFTQMTKVLDILEQFLNIHGHKYLRLDGATKVEQRQILTDRFNHDTRILCFILSTRSGGLGINLTGADTVIFYDQDWNPAMDKQCQDRCHRIGQTRDVHIYRLVSEHTIEANILRKASQKQMLDDVVIQEGEFTTDYFNKISARDVIGDGSDGDRGAPLGEGDVAANAAMDRVLGGVESTDQRTAGRVLEQAEDREDVDAARVAEKEIQQDDADFNEKPAHGGGGSASGVSSVRFGTPRDEGASLPRSGLGIFSELAGNDDANGGMEAQPVEVEYNAWGERIRTIDDYMLDVMAAQLEGTPLELPKDKKKSKKKGKDTRKR